MKTILIFALLSLFMAGCSRRDARTRQQLTDASSTTNVLTPVLTDDPTIQKELIGTWQRVAGGFHVTNIIASDGRYQRLVVGANNVTVNSSEGSLIATNGVLIETTTKSGNTNVPIPQVVQWQIVHLDQHELVISSQFNTDKGPLVKTYEKVGK